MQRQRGDGGFGGLTEDDDCGRETHARSMLGGWDERKNLTVRRTDATRALSW